MSSAALYIYMLRGYSDLDYTTLAERFMRLPPQALLRSRGRPRKSGKEEPKVLGATGENMRGGEVLLSQLHRSVVAAMGGLPKFCDYEDVELTRLNPRACESQHFIKDGFYRWNAAEVYLRLSGFRFKSSGTVNTPSFRTRSPSK